MLAMWCIGVFKWWEGRGRRN